jgi:predicted metalloprotease
VWTELFAESGRTYDLPKLVLFDEAVRSACGMQDAAVGPFYCPPDGTVYLDLGFFRDLSRRHGAPGDFARAYVIAHEVGHHVQDLLGTAGSVRASQASAGDSRANQLSVRLELQADFFAGVWAHHASSSGVLEEGDLEEALRAASQIGDDRLQMESQGYVKRCRLGNTMFQRTGFIAIRTEQHGNLFAKLNNGKVKIVQWRGAACPGPKTPRSASRGRQSCSPAWRPRGSINYR